MPKLNNLEDKTGEVTIHGGIVHCPGGHRSWTVELLEGVLKLYCLQCKRCFILHAGVPSLSGKYVLITLNKTKFVNALDLK